MKLYAARLFIILSSIIFIFTACGEQITGDDDEKDKPSDREETQQEIVDEKESDDQKGEEPEEEEQSNEKDEKAETEELSTEYKVSDNWSIIPTNDQVEEEVVLLTIDDAPENHAVEMSHTLKDIDADAIFFVNGHFLETEEDKEKLQEIYDLGFAIGNHTYSHANLAELSKEEQREEIVSVNDMVEEIIGERPIFFRPPFGSYGDETYDI